MRGPELAGGVARPAGIARVLMTADAVGGVWPYALDLAAALRDRSVDVTLAVMGPAPSPAQLAAASRAATIAARSCRLEWMSDPWDDVREAAEWLLDLERRVRPDVVHLNGYCHAALPWRAPCVIVAHSCVCSWWRAVHGVEAPPAFDRYRREVARGVTAARVVIAPTAAMGAALEREYDVPAGVRVIPNGRPDRPPCPPGRKQPFIFSAGRLWDAAKNIDSLGCVASSLPWPVYVAGSDSSPDGRRAPHASMRHVGRLEAHEMDEWFARAAIYALPARYEPFGLSVLDAALAGCALVLGDIPSLRENWDGAAGFVPPDNRRAMAGALTQLIESPAERRRLSARARARACRFRLADMAEAYLSAYRSVLRPHLALSAAAGRQAGDRGVIRRPIREAAATPT